MVFGTQGILQSPSTPPKTTKSQKLYVLVKPRRFSERRPGTLCEDGWGAMLLSMDMLFRVAPGKVESKELFLLIESPGRLCILYKFQFFHATPFQVNFALAAFDVTCTTLKRCGGRADC